MMTRQEEIYADTLNTFGTDQEPELIQDLLDAEHKNADPDFVPERIRHAEEVRAAQCRAASLVLPSPVVDLARDVADMLVPGVTFVDSKTLRVLDSDV